MIFNPSKVDETVPAWGANECFAFFSELKYLAKI